MSAGVFVLVLCVLVSVDTRVREQVETRVATTASVKGTATQLHDTGSALWDTARTQGIDHAPMTVFVVIAGVLLLCMMRS